MAGIVGEISSITLPNGSAYGLKDSTSRLSCAELSAVISSMQEELSGKSSVFIKDPGAPGYEDGKQSDLSIVKLTPGEYAQLVALSATESNTLYIMSSEYEDMFGMQIKNLSAGTDLSDAITLEQLSNAVSSRLEATDISAQYVNQHIHLSAKGQIVGDIDCGDFIKDGMLSTVELCSGQLIFTFNTDAGHSDISVALSNFINETDYYKKTETSSASQLSEAFSNCLSEVPSAYKTYDSTLSSLSDDGYALVSQLSVKADISALDKKITIDDHILGVCQQVDLSIIKLSTDEYEQIAGTSSMLSNALYIVEGSFEDAYGRQIKNVAPGTDLSDAVNLEQLSSAVSGIQIPTDLSAFTNSPGYLSSVPDSYKTYDVTVSSLSDNGYALQSQVSSKADTSAVMLLSANQTQVIDLGGQSRITLNYADHYIQVTGHDNGIEFNEGTYNTFQNGAYIELTDVSSYITMSNPTCLRFADSHNNLSDLLSSNYQLKGDYLSSNALNDYYSKSQTSSAAEISDAFNAKSSIVIKTANVSSSLGTLIVNNVTQQEYIALSAAGQTVSSELYIIDPDSANLDARGDWVTNVKTPELSSDAANKAYVDEQLSSAGGGFSFEIYYPPYNSAAQTYVLKPGKFNILSARVKNNDNIILEDYTVDQVYKVQLTGNAATAVSVNLLVDTNAGDVLPGAYSDSSIASCLTKIARGEVYNFEVSYGNVTFDNDFNGDSLRTLNPYGINPIYGGGYEKYELMPLNNTCNHLSIAASNSEYDNMQFDLAIPCRVRTNKVRRMRQFSISFKTEFSERGMSLNFPSTDINGSSLSWQFICGWQYAKTPKRGDVLTFTEYQKDVLLVDIQNVNQNLWYSFITPTPLSGVVTMKDRCVNYVNITTTANSYWEWSDGENRAPPYYNSTLDPPQWVNGGGNYDIINSDAGPSETMLCIYPDPNDHDESTIVVGQLVTTYAINSGNGTIAMPPAIPGKCRDFLLRLRIDASNVPNITFTGGNFETESGQFPVLEEGVQVLSFTEVKTNTFMLGCKKMTVAS